MTKVRCCGCWCTPLGCYTCESQLESSLAWPDPIPHRGKGSRIWPRSSLSPHTVECVPITAQYSVTWYLKYVINGKIQNSVCVASKLEVCEVRWARNVLNHELQHSRNRNRKCRKVTSLTSAIAIADIMTGFTWLIKFLGDKLLCGHVADSFLWPRETSLKGVFFTSCILMCCI